jgi:hypothetical protein
MPVSGEVHRQARAELRVALRKLRIEGTGYLPSDIRTHLFQCEECKDAIQQSIDRNPENTTYLGTVNKTLTAVKPYEQALSEFFIES